MHRAAPRDRIIHAAIRLFARKGYAATGVRELARSAHVNPAMINYYFGGKLEILKRIIDRFFTRYQEIAQQMLPGDGSVESRIRRFVRAAMMFFRDNRDLMIIGLTELPLDVPELADFKAERVCRVKDIFIREIFPEPEDHAVLREIAPIIGPALVGMMAGQFIFRPVIEKIGHAVIDDRYYERAADLIAAIFLHGLQPAVGNFRKETGR